MVIKVIGRTIFWRSTCIVVTITKYDINIFIPCFCNSELHPDPIWMFDTHTSF